MNIEQKIKETSHIKLAIISALIGVIATVIAFAGFDVELAKFANKIMNAGFVFSAFMLYKIYYYSKGINTDAKIFESPIAVAIDNGLLVLAIAWAVSGGF